MAMMHNVTARLNSSFFFGVWAIGILAGINVFTSFFIEQPFEVSLISVQNTKLYGNNFYKWDEAEFEFTLKADLRGVCNWNIKLIYLYLEVDYFSESRNEVIIWDKIIWRDALNQTIIDIKKNKGKYLVKTKAHDLRGKTPTATLKWEVIPITGFVYKMKSAPISFSMLKDYTKS